MHSYVGPSVWVCSLVRELDLADFFWPIVHQECMQIWRDRWDFVAPYAEQSILVQPMVLWMKDTLSIEQKLYWLLRNVENFASWWRTWIGLRRDEDHLRWKFRACCKSGQNVEASEFCVRTRSGTYRYRWFPTAVRTLQTGNCETTEYLPRMHVHPPSCCILPGTVPARTLSYQRHLQTRMLLLHDPKERFCTK